MFLSRFSIYIFAQYKYSLFEHMRTILKTNTFDLARYYIYAYMYIQSVEFFTGIKMEEKRLEGVGEG